MLFEFKMDWQLLWNGRQSDTIVKLPARKWMDFFFFFVENNPDDFKKEPSHPQDPLILVILNEFQVPTCKYVACNLG